MISRLHFYKKKISSCACLVGSGLKLTFRWKAHSPIFFKLLFRSIFDASAFLTTNKSDVSSANNLGFDARLSDKSLIEIKKNSGQELNPGELQLQP